MTPGVNHFATSRLRTITHRQFRPTPARPPQSIIIQCTHALGYSLVLVEIIAVQPAQNQDYRPTKMAIRTLFKLSPHHRVSTSLAKQHIEPRLFVYLECPARLTEHTRLRFGSIGRVHQVVRETFVRPPGTHPVSS